MFYAVHCIGILDANVFFFSVRYKFRSLKSETLLQTLASKQHKKGQKGRCHKGKKVNNGRVLITDIRF